MNWSPEASKKIQRVPFFIRRMVKKKVEDYAKENGINVITVEHIEILKKHFMKNQSREVKGFSVETCLGADGCPNRNLSATDLPDRVEAFLRTQDLRHFLEEKLRGNIKIHNEFRVSISFCPNSCSRPQIVDIGLIGAVVPEVVNASKCDSCKACVSVCQENAISLSEMGPILEFNKCLYCGSCIKICKKGVIKQKKEGFRCLIGGKLGRHPQLGHELPEIYSDKKILKIIEATVAFYKLHNRDGERLGAIISKTGLAELYKALNIPYHGEIFNNEV